MVRWKWHCLTSGPFGRIASSRALVSSFLYPHLLPFFREEALCSGKLASSHRAVGHDALSSHLLAPYAIATLGTRVEKSYGKPKGNVVGSVAVLARGGSRFDAR